MIDTRPSYPPEFDEPEICLVCGRHTDDCDCPECTTCASVGDPNCYNAGHLKPLADSIQGLIDHLGYGTTLRENFSAIERHAEPMHGVWIILADGQRFGSPEDSQEARAKLDTLPTYTRIAKVGVSGIAWDGSNWEWYDDGEPGPAWEYLDTLREAFAEALAEHDAETEAEAEEY